MIKIKNGFRFNGSIEFEDRKPLVNTTDYSAKNFVDREYSSNDPQNPTNFSPSFTAHKIWTLNLGTTINFGTKYLSYPDRKFTVYNNKYPSIYIGYRKMFGSDNSQKNSDYLFTQLRQNFSLGNLGNTKYRIKGGLFLEQKNINFKNAIVITEENLFSKYNILLDQVFKEHTEHIQYYMTKDNSIKTAINLSERIIEDEIEKLLTKVEMLDKASSFPHLISGGEQQRVAIARALINNPELIIADEPTGNLDPETSEKIMTLLKSVAKNDKTVIMATHDFDIINKFPGRIVKFENKKIQD